MVLPPKGRPSNGLPRQALTAYPGAIALVEAREVKPGMKVLKVDGRLAEDENYTLRY